MVPSTQPIPPTTAPTTTPTATTPSSNAPQPNRNPLGSAQSANYFSQMLNMMANNSIVNIMNFYFHRTKIIFVTFLKNK